MNTNLKKKRNAFTLPEVLVYITVLTVITLTTSTLFLWMNRSNNKAKASRETVNNVRRAVSALIYEIREAKSIYTPASVFSDNNGRLSLETTKNTPSGETRTYVDFYLCEQRLCIKRENQLPVALTSDKVQIEILNFSQVFSTSSRPSVEIILKANYKPSSIRAEDQFSINTTSTASLRTH